MDYNKINADTFCISPWYEIRIDVDGSVRFCHACKKTDTTQQDFLEWFNRSNLIQQTRLDLLNGASIPECNVCYRQEESGQYSFRHRRNFQAAIHPTYFIESLKQSPANCRINNANTIKPAFIHVSLSNLCNLACRMCKPFYSSKLTQQFKKFNLVDQSLPNTLDWTEDATKWNSFLELIKDNPNLISLHVMGGEPTVHNRFYELVDWCIENNCVDFHFTFVTNGTRLDQDFMTKLSAFRSVQIEVSVENFHPSNDYVRQGGDYITVQQNIKRYLEHKPANTNIVLRPVPQALTIEHYYTLIDFAIAHQTTLDNNNLLDPAYLRVTVLPKWYKDRIAEQLRNKYAYYLELKDNVGTNAINLRSLHLFDVSLRNHITYLLKLLTESEPDNINELRQQFVKFNRTLDVNDKFITVYPELKEFYYEHS